jgi:hypothetical protein
MRLCEIGQRRALGMIRHFAAMGSMQAADVVEVQ